LADAAYGNDSKFRQALSGMGLDYLAGVQSTLSVWPPGMEPLKPKEWKGKGRRPKLLQRSAEHQPILAEDLARELPASAWKKISWRKGTKETLRSRFAAVRIRPAHRDIWSTEPWPEQWILVEWPKTEAKPTKYWLGTMPARIGLKKLVALAKHRWIIERDYEELKQELGLRHFEGRGWRGFHHHATLCIAAYGFLVAERSRFSRSARGGQLKLALPKILPGWQPRGSRSAA